MTDPGMDRPAQTDPDLAIGRDRQARDEDRDTSGDRGLASDADQESYEADARTAAEAADEDIEEFERSRDESDRRAPDSRAD